MRFGDFLTESFDSDFFFRQEAEKFANLLISYVKNHAEDLDSYPRNRQTRGFVIEGTELNPRFKNLKIILGSSKQMGEIGDDSSVAAFFGTSKGFYVIGFYVLLGNYDTKYIDTRITGAKINIIHEFTHYLDILRSVSRKKIKGSAKKAEKSMKEYYNSPEEFNAYYQEGLSNIYSLFLNDKIPLHNKRQWLGNSIEDFLEMLGTLGFNEDFLDELDNKYTRKLKKRIYDVYLHLKQLVKNSEDLTL